MPPLHILARDAVEFCWIIWITIWIILALGNKRTIYRQPWSQRGVYVLIVVCGGIGMHFLPHPFLPIFPVTVAGDIAGAALCALGLGWSIWARFVLGRNWSGMVTLKENHELIRSGPYRFTRHPIYKGILAAIAGTVLSLAFTPIGICEYALLSAAFIVKLRQEESLMLQQFPDTYRAYKMQVKAALVPLIW